MRILRSKEYPDVVRAGLSDRWFRLSGIDTRYSPLGSNFRHCQCPFGKENQVRIKKRRIFEQYQVVGPTGNGWIPGFRNNRLYTRWGNMKNRSGARNAGFSLLELLVVLGILVILTGGTMSAVTGIRQWQAKIRSDSVMNELELALRLYRSDTGHWPDKFSLGEVAVNVDGGASLEALEPYLESINPDETILDGYGNADLYLLIDLDGDNWIEANDFHALPASARPVRIRNRVTIYSLDKEGRLAACNW